MIRQHSIDDDDETDSPKRRRSTPHRREFSKLDDDDDDFDRILLRSSSLANILDGKLSTTNRSMDQHEKQRQEMDVVTVESSSSPPPVSTSPTSPFRYSLLRDRLLESSTTTPTTSNNYDSPKFSKFFIDGQRGFDGNHIDLIDDPFRGLDNDLKIRLRDLRGIEKLYEWQESCLLQHQRKQDRNLLVSLPTSGGKTLLAEVLILKTLCSDKDALFVLPFVSIVQEKIKALQSLLDARGGSLVEEYAGSRGRIPPIRRRCNKNSVYVATIEKSQLLLNSLIKAKRIDQIGLVIIDEYAYFTFHVHMLGEGRNRGAKLEQIITTLKIAAKSTRIVGLSATLCNVDEVADFMEADVFTSDFRPVPLTECVKLGNTVYKVQQSEGVQFKDILHVDRKMPENTKKADDPDGISDLVAEVVPNASCLVFCPTKKNTENVAAFLSKTLPRTLLQHRREEKRILLKQLQDEMGISTASSSSASSSSTNGQSDSSNSAQSHASSDASTSKPSSMAQSGGWRLDKTLQRCIELGVAYHHSGLTTDERQLLQEAFLNGTLCVICCTSTLAAGVNLPARRVILRCPLIGREFLSKQQYKQMIGRAGRAGMDSSGESFLVITGKQVQKTLLLLQGSVERCESSLMKESSSDLGRYLLNMIGLQLIAKTSDLVDLIKRTLAYTQSPVGNRETLVKHCESIANELIASSLVKKMTTKVAVDEGGAQKKEQTDGVGEQEESSLVLTKFGMAVMDSGIPTEVAPTVYEHLRTSVQCLVLSSHLHLLYCIVPLDDTQQLDELRVDWNVLYEEYCSLNKADKNVFDVLSIPESFLLRKKMGISGKPEQDQISQRLYAALILHRLWRGESVWSVAERYRLFRGVVQNLSQSCASSASSLLRFVENLDDLWALKQLLPDFTKRLSNCAKPELLPLMEIQGVRQARANQLYQGGYKTIASLASAEPKDVMKSIENLSRRQANQIITSAKMLIREKMEILAEQAEESGLSVMDLISTLSQVVTG